jgi:hypothetical protein
LNFFWPADGEGFEITGLYEIHNPVFDVDRLKWYYGFGAHAGFYDGDYTYNRWGERGRKIQCWVWMESWALEYSFTEIPFNLSIDWKPTFNFYGYSGFWGDGGALSIGIFFNQKYTKTGEIEKFEAKSDKFYRNHIKTIFMEPKRTFKPKNPISTGP